MLCILPILNESFLPLSERQAQAYFRTLFSSSWYSSALPGAGEVWLSSRDTEERRKLLPTDNHLQASEKTDHVPNNPGGNYYIFLQVEETQLGQAHGMDKSWGGWGLANT